ncbi:hypothetical protein LZ30DRAFT_75308 [Colletotrichum cereale]|nr:hypothetical protein LZ30DRAFT_75308 [Colletotrichum cereale]
MYLWTKIPVPLPIRLCISMYLDSVSFHTLTPMKIFIDRSGSMSLLVSNLVLPFCELFSWTPPPLFSSQGKFRPLHPTTCLPSQKCQPESVKPGLSFWRPSHFGSVRNLHALSRRCEPRILRSWKSARPSAALQVTIVAVVDWPLRASNQGTGFD